MRTAYAEWREEWREKNGRTKYDLKTGQHAPAPPEEDPEADFTQAQAQFQSIVIVNATALSNDVAINLTKKGVAFRLTNEGKGYLGGQAPGGFGVAFSLNM